MVCKSQRIPYFENLVQFEFSLRPKLLNICFSFNFISVDMLISRDFSFIDLLSKIFDSAKLKHHRNYNELTFGIQTVDHRLENI